MLLAVKVGNFFPQ